MLTQTDNKVRDFPALNTGFNTIFKPGKLSLGLVAPLESYAINATPSMKDHIERIQLAESLGFSALWLRDVPFNVPSFGDAGQMFDPFVYLGVLAAQTSKIALGVASVILPLRHPAHVAKAAATADLLSGGRVILGVASGDRPEEYPAMNISYPERGEKFRESYAYIRHAAASYPTFENTYGSLAGDMDILPKPTNGRVPLLVTGASQQSPDWLANHSDGWISYPRPTAVQQQIIHQLRDNLSESQCPSKPFMEPLYVDISDDPDCPPQPIHLGYRLGTRQLLNYLTSRQAIGVNHIALNLRFNKADITTTLETLAKTVLPTFNEQDK